MTKTVDLFTTPLLFSLTLMATGLIACAEINDGEPPPRLPANPDTVPPRPSGESAIRFVVLADMNSAYGSTTYNRHVHKAIEMIREELQPDFVFSAGDMIAGQHRDLSDENIRAMWEGFNRAIYNPLRESGIPFAPVTGNHDASGYPAFERERVLYREHWTQPEQVPALDYLNDDQYPFHYTFAFGDAFFMALDITTMDPMDEALWQWMEEQLVAAEAFSFRFAASHIPPYPISIGRESQVLRPADAERLRELFVRHGVDAYFTGHHHAYFKGRKEGLNLVSLNCAGSGPRPLIGIEAPQLQSFFVVDIAGDRITQAFTINSDGTVFSDRTLPEYLEHEDVVLPRFDR
jgi:predicted phosphodiesterase